MKYLFILVLFSLGSVSAHARSPKVGEWSKDEPPCSCITSQEWSKKTEQQKNMSYAQFGKVRVKKAE